MNFVTQPAVELYKAITSEIYKEAAEVGGIRESSAWKALTAGAGKRWKGVVGLETPETLAAAITGAFNHHKINYGELTFFGDTRYSEEGTQIRAILDEAANRIREEVDPDANIIVGSTLDTEMEGAMRVSVVATGIDASESVHDIPVPRRSMAAPCGRLCQASGKARSTMTRRTASTPASARQRRCARKAAAARPTSPP